MLSKQEYAAGEENVTGIGKNSEWERKSRVSPAVPLKVKNEKLLRINSSIIAIWEEVNRNNPCITDLCFMHKNNVLSLCIFAIVKC